MDFPGDLFGELGAASLVGRSADAIKQTLRFMADAIAVALGPGLATRSLDEAMAHLLGNMDAALARRGEPPALDVLAQLADSHEDRDVRDGALEALHVCPPCDYMLAKIAKSSQRLKPLVRKVRASGMAWLDYFGNVLQCSG